MRFSLRTKNAARYRQWGRCGVCGESLNDIEEFAHHVWPHRLKGPNDVDNCVILCRECHYVVHAHGGFRTLIVAPRTYFEYWNG